MDVPADLPYRQQIVVSGVLEPGQVVDSIQFLKTLPVSDSFSIEKAAIADVIASIRVADRDYPLRYLGDGFYTTDSLVARSGETFELSAQWRDMEAIASTRVPYPVDSEAIAITFRPAIEPRSGDTSYYRIQATFTPTAGQVYGLGYDLVNGANVSQAHGGLQTRDAIVRPRDTLANGELTLVSREDSPLEGPPFRGIIRVYAFDAPYYAFHISFGNDESGDRVFSGSQEKVEWNVVGDGIGIFIGRAVTNVRL